MPQTLYTTLESTNRDRVRMRSLENHFPVYSKKKMKKFLCQIYITRVFLKKVNTNLHRIKKYLLYACDNKKKKN